MTPVCVMRASSSVETISMKSFLARQKQQKKPARSAHATRKETCPAMVVWATTYVTIVIITTARLLLRAANEQARKKGRQGPVSQALSLFQAPLASHVQWRRDHFPFGRWCGMQKCPAREGVCHAVFGAVERPRCDWLGVCALG